MTENTRNSELKGSIDLIASRAVDHPIQTRDVRFSFSSTSWGIFTSELEALIASKVEEARIEWLDKQILHLLTDIYPEDIFTPPTKEDFDRINDFDANLHTRLHCDGIRHGLHVLRREVRGLSARDDLEALQSKEGYS